jgi:hypothetical protein
MFPRENDPSGGMLCFCCWLTFAYIEASDPETWTREELRRWLAAVRRLSLYLDFYSLQLTPAFSSTNSPLIAADKRHRSSATNIL